MGLELMQATKQQIWQLASNDTKSFIKVFIKAFNAKPTNIKIGDNQWNDSPH